MAVATASGVISTEDILADEKVVDMVNKHQLLTKDTSQFMTILNKLPSEKATREKVNWLEDDYFPNLTTLAASAGSADASLSVATDTGAYFRVGDLVRIGRSGEIVEVTGITTDSIGVTRSIGHVAAATAQTGEDLLIVSNVSAQGADYGTLKVTTRVLGFNYTQITRHPFGATNTQKAINTYGSMDWFQNESVKKGVEHKRALENTCWVGARDFSSGSEKGWMGGVVTEYISTNVTSAVGTLSLSALDIALEAIYQYGSDNKVIFAAPRPAGALSRLMGSDWVQASPQNDRYGVHVDFFYNGAYGFGAPVITKKEWGREQAANGQRGGWMVVLDLGYIKKRPLRNTQLLQNRQGNGVDSQINEYLTEMSLQVACEKAHGILKGITG